MVFEAVPIAEATVEVAAIVCVVMKRIDQYTSAHEP